jgi:superfamily II DNA or RNA helicase
MRIAEDTRSLWSEGRKILILTERTNHLEKLQEILVTKGVSCHILYGRLSRKQRMIVLDELKAMPDATARVILATGRLIGEGFDHSPLDTMILEPVFTIKMSNAIVFACETISNGDSHTPAT